MKQNRLIAIFTYLLLIAGCMGIVFVADKAAGISVVPYNSTAVDDALSQWEKEEDSQESSVPEVNEGERQGESYLEDGKETPKGAERRKWYTHHKGTKPEKAEVQTKEEPKGPPRLILATDIHYMSSRLTDYGKAFEAFVEDDDGKAVRYSSELMDAFLQEVLEFRPDALILSGDLTADGEKVNHQELAGKLERLQKEGVQVLVIPGNHDINNPNAASYIGEEKQPADQVTPEEFLEIYRSFGYEQAASRDENSLSYRYVLDEAHWLLMLDSCQYEPYNKVGGKIKPETYQWIRRQYEEAEAAGAVMIPVAHHNLMGESRVYSTECAIEGGEELVSILEEYGVPLYLSGHLHLQRIKQYQPEPGKAENISVTEAVTGALSIAPCQYGIICWQEGGIMDYRLGTVDVSAWAEENRLEDENLLDFETYSQNLVKNVVADQIYKKLDAIPEEMKKLMSDLYGQLNYEYCAGKAADKREIRSSDGYRLWERNRGDSREMALIEKMIADLKEDNISWESKIVSDTE